MALTEKQLALHVTRALNQRSEAILAYFWPQTWAGADRLEIAGRVLPVESCDSVLELRERLVNHADQARVLLVSVPESELGQDVLARLHTNHLLHVDRWQMIEEAVGTRQIDSRLYNLPWMADALLEVPANRVVGITALTYEHALELCLAPLLGLPEDRFELEDLLTGCEHAVKAWNSLPEDRRAVYAKFLQTRFGPVASAIIGAVAAGHGHAVVSIGLACEVLYGERAQANPEMRDGQIRLEGYLDRHRLTESAGRQWAQAAERVLSTRSEAGKVALLQGATELLRTVGADKYIIESALLPSAFDARLDALGTAIQQFLKKPEQLLDVEQAAVRVASHRLTPADDPGREAAKMALALCRRERALLSSGGHPSNLVSDYIENGAWEDYARRLLRVVSPDVFARAVTLLLERVADRRLAIDQKFATQLADSQSNSSVMAGTLPVEAALDQVIAPLAAETPLILLVLDGMSWDVYHAISSDLGRQGWIGRRLEGGLRSLLATVPSVTEFSRTSLLCGRLAQGTSAIEKAGFAAHPALLRASQSRSPTAFRSQPPVLLHKAELVTGMQLSEEAIRQIANPDQRIVGIVINAIDDALCKSDQVRCDWSVEKIPLLGAVLTQAKLAARAVVITSDHGHVLEMGSQYRKGGDAERWRSADQPPAEGEIQVGGSRLRALMNAEIVVPWSEKIRYATKKNGYHGGVSRQEMLVPIGYWMPASDTSPTYLVHVPSVPDWWDAAPAPVTTSPPAVPKGREGKSQPQHDLFTAKVDKSWISPVLSSPLLIQQRERIGRIALNDDRLTRLLQCLDQRGGRATTTQLATAIEQPLLRIRGIVSTLQRMLNVDGYPIITMETATGTVILNPDLLRKQFDL